MVDDETEERILQKAAYIAEVVDSVPNWFG